MKKHLGLCVLLSLFVLNFFSQSAMAQKKTTGSELQIGIGGEFLGGDTWLLRFKMAPTMALEGMFDLSRSSREIQYYDPKKDEYVKKDITTTNIGLGAGALMGFGGNGRVNPYIGGRGMLSITMETDEDTKTRIGLAPIAGSEYFVTDRFSLSFELQFWLWFGDGSNQYTTTVGGGHIYF